MENNMVENTITYKVVYDAEQKPWTHTEFFSEYHVAKSFWHIRKEDNKNPELYEIRMVRTETKLD